MLDNRYLDTIISVVLIYALLSIIVSLLLEAWNSLRKQRGEFLWKTIDRMLRDAQGRADYGTALYADPVITTLFTGTGRKPAYISAKDFTHALIATLTRLHPPPPIPVPPGGNAAPLSASPRPLGRAFEAAVAAMPPNDMKTLFKGFIDRNMLDGEVHPDRLRDDICRWYDDRMDRASGEYKLGQRWKLFAFGMITAVGLNVDSLHLVRMVLMDKPMRDNLVAQAGVAADAYQAGKPMGEAAAEIAVLKALHPDTTGMRRRMDSLAVRAGVDSLLAAQAQRLDTVLALIDQWKLPIGWNTETVPSAWCKPAPTKTAAGMGPTEMVLMAYMNRRNDPTPINLFLYCLGIITTGFALSFGAPFWFEVLVKLVNIRRTGTDHAASKR